MNNVTVNLLCGECRNFSHGECKLDRWIRVKPTLDKSIHMFCEEFDGPSSDTPQEPTSNTIMENSAASKITQTIIKKKCYTCRHSGYITSQVQACCYHPPTVTGYPVVTIPLKCNFWEEKEPQDIS